MDNENDNPELVVKQEELEEHKITSDVVSDVESDDEDTSPPALAAATTVVEEPLLATRPITPPPASADGSDVESDDDAAAEELQSFPELLLSRQNLNKEEVLLTESSAEEEDTPPPTSASAAAAAAAEEDWKLVSNKKARARTRTLNREAEDEIKAVAAAAAAAAEDEIEAAEEEAAEEEAVSANLKINKRAAKAQAKAKAKEANIRAAKARARADQTGSDNEKVGKIDRSTSYKTKVRTVTETVESDPEPFNIKFDAIIGGNTETYESIIDTDYEILVKHTNIKFGTLFDEGIKITLTELNKETMKLEVIDKKDTKENSLGDTIKFEWSEDIITNDIEYGDLEITNEYELTCMFGPENKFTNTCKITKKNGTTLQDEIIEIPGSGSKKIDSNPLIPLLQRIGKNINKHLYNDNLDLNLTDNNSEILKQFNLLESAKLEDILKYLIVFYSKSNTYYDIDFPGMLDFMYENFIKEDKINKNITKLITLETDTEPNTDYDAIIEKARLLGTSFQAYFSDKKKSNKFDEILSYIMITGTDTFKETDVNLYAKTTITPFNSDKISKSKDNVKTILFLSSKVAEKRLSIMTEMLKASKVSTEDGSTKHGSTEEGSTEEGSNKDVYDSQEFDKYLYSQSSTVNGQSSTVNGQSSTVNGQSSTVNSQSSDKYPVVVPGNIFLNNPDNSNVFSSPSTNVPTNILGVDIEDLSEARNNLSLSNWENIFDDKNSRQMPHTIASKPLNTLDEMFHSDDDSADAEYNRRFSSLAAAKTKTGPSVAAEAKTKISSSAEAKTKISSSAASKTKISSSAAAKTETGSSAAGVPPSFSYAEYKAHLPAAPVPPVPPTVNSYAAAKLRRTMSAPVSSNSSFEDEEE
jgi:hypothetical protein